MTTHSLILSPHEVRAALAGRLGLVVRPVKPQPTNGLRWNVIVVNGYGGWTDKHGRPFPCPLGGPGTKLVCKETWHTDERDLVQAQAMHEDVMSSSPIFYQADPANRNAGCIWRSPATMPAWASRITLEVVGVRCVRVQEITEGDIYNIGAEWNLKHAHTDGIDVLGGFIRWWNQYYVKRGLSWGSNPFVWAVEVRRVEG